MVFQSIPNYSMNIAELTVTLRLQRSDISKSDPSKC